MGNEWADNPALTRETQLKMALTELALLESLTESSDKVLSMKSLEESFNQNLQSIQLILPMYTHNEETFKGYVDRMVQSEKIQNILGRGYRLTRIGEFRLIYLRLQRISDLMEG